MSQKKDQNLLSSRRHSAKPVKQKRSGQKFQPSIYITRELSQQDILLIKQAFDFYDSNGQGLLSPNDLKQALFSLGYYASRDTIYGLISECDSDGLGGLTFDAFITVVGSNVAQSETVSDLKKVFRKYDRENKGYIVQNDIFETARSLSEPMTEQQSRKLFKKLDLKNQGRIEFEQFCQLMHHPNSLK